MPIQALTVRELIYDEKGNIVRQPPRPPRPRFSFGPTGRAVGVGVDAAELLPGQKREEVEGVFVVRDGRALFVPVKIGIAGERYFEVAGGLKEGDRVITGPFESVRNLFDGDLVQIDTTPGSGEAGGASQPDVGESLMSQIFESVRLALSSIWANKLRSLLTLLGNIVAVSSIITVVSLIRA